jgi:hypothetical protein
LILQAFRKRRKRKAVFPEQLLEAAVVYTPLSWASSWREGVGKGGLYPQQCPVFSTDRIADW